MEVLIQNVQTTREVSASPLRARLVDFGHYGPNLEPRQAFMVQASDLPRRWGSVFWPRDPDWVGPEAGLHLQADLAKWRSVRPEHKSWYRSDRKTYSGVKEFATTLAARCAAFELTSEGFEQEVNEFVARAFPWVVDLAPRSTGAKWPKRSFSE